MKQWSNEVMNEWMNWWNSELGKQQTNNEQMKKMNETMNWWMS
jgi:hypothetical protein